MLQVLLSIVCDATSELGYKYMSSDWHVDDRKLATLSTHSPG